MTLKGLELSVVLVLLLGFTCLRVDGICSVEKCTDLTRCVLSRDQRRCKCAAGFYGDQCDQNGQMKVMCSRDYIAIRVKEDFFKYYKVPLESLHLPNKSCRARKELVGGVSYYMSSISKEKYLTCGGRPLETNFTHISYSLSLLMEPRVIGNIIRDPVVKIDYTCVFPYVRSVSLPFPVVPFSSEMVLRVDELDAVIQLMLYKDHTYTKAFTSSPTIELQEKVYVEVAVTVPPDFFLLRINDCWASQSPKPNSTVGSVHTLLLNGCVNDDTVSFLNVSEGQSGRNGESSTIRYSFDMFRFTSEPNSFYLHCTVQLCEPDDFQSCKPICNSITKREAVRAEPMQGLLSYGPIKIDMPDPPRSNILLTVVLPVVGVWTVGFFLSILIVVAKAGSRRLTQAEQH